MARDLPEGGASAELARVGGDLGRPIAHGAEHVEALHLDGGRCGWREVGLEGGVHGRCERQRHVVSAAWRACGFSDATLYGGISECEVWM